MLKRKFVTLVVEYDDNEVAHPNEWDWATLVEDETTKILRIEVFGMGAYNE